MLAEPTRPLHEKFRALMEYLRGSLAEAWGGRDIRETSQKMMRAATMISGGIELA